MRVDQTVAGHVPQPELERHGGVREILPQPSVGLEEHILNDVAGIDPALHAAIHAAIDHPLDRRAVPFEQSVDSPVVTLANPLEQHERGLWLGRGSRPVGGAVWGAGDAGWGGHGGRTDWAAGGTVAWKPHRTNVSPGRVLTAKRPAGRRVRQRARFPSDQDTVFCPVRKRVP